MKWDRWTIDAAAEQGNLEMVKYCVANECPIDEYACACAAENGHLEVLKYLHEEAKRLGIIEYCLLGGFKWSSSHTRISCRA